MMRWERSPAPFEVPPESTTRSQAASAPRTARSSAASSSGNAPNATGSPPASVTAAAMIAPLLSKTRPGPSTPPGATSSSPVESTATFGRRITSTD